VWTYVEHCSIKKKKGSEQDNTQEFSTYLSIVKVTIQDLVCKSHSQKPQEALDLSVAEER
jgi:hypothetical protein